MSTFSTLRMEHKPTGTTVRISSAARAQAELLAPQMMRLSTVRLEPIKFRISRNCLTDFHGMSLARDKLCSLIRKWTTLIEAFADVKTTDGYVVRMFVIAFTKKRP